MDVYGGVNAGITRAKIAQNFGLKIKLFFYLKKVQKSNYSKITKIVKIVKMAQKCQKGQKLPK